MIIGALVTVIVFLMAVSITYGVRHYNKLEVQRKMAEIKAAELKHLRELQAEADKREHQEKAKDNDLERTERQKDAEVDRTLKLKDNGIGIENIEATILTPPRMQLPTGESNDTGQETRQQQSYPQAGGYDSQGYPEYGANSTRYHR